MAHNQEVVESLARVLASMVERGQIEEARDKLDRMADSLRAEVIEELSNYRVRVWL